MSIQTYRVQSYFKMNQLQLKIALNMLVFMKKKVLQIINTDMLIKKNKGTILLFSKR